MRVVTTFICRVLIACAVIPPIEPDPARGLLACVGFAAILGIEVGWER
jgi:hypothetical protein